MVVQTVIVVLLLFCVRHMRAELKEMRTALKQMEMQRYVEERLSDDEAEGNQASGADDLGGISVVNVEKPKRRTLSEAIRKLDELGKDNPTIAQIAANSALYPDDMLKALANNPELADFVAGYPGGKEDVPSGLTEAEKAQDFPLLLQWDPRWGYQSYGSDGNIGLSGCGPTCLSMILYYLTGNDECMPDKLADYAMENGYYVEGTGTAWALMEDVPKLYDIYVTKPEITERALKSELDQGNILICAMREGDFTASGHFIVIYGYDEKGFQVNDSNCVARSLKRWEFSDIKNQIKMCWSYSKHKNVVTYKIDAPY